MNIASKGADGEPSANIPPIARDSGTKSRSIAMVCGRLRFLADRIRSTCMNTRPPNRKIATPHSGEPKYSCPSGTRTNAMAASRMPPPNAMIACRSSCSSQSGRIRSTRPSSPPTRMQDPLAVVKSSIETKGSIALAVYAQAQAYISFSIGRCARNQSSIRCMKDAAG